MKIDETDLKDSQLQEQIRYCKSLKFWGTVQTDRPMNIVKTRSRKYLLPLINILSR